MGLIKFLQIAVMVTSLIKLVESVIVVRFDRAPPVRTRFTTAKFQYSVKRLDGFNECKYNGCLIHCELDGQALESCPAHIIILNKLTVNTQHSFTINITTWDGDKNSSVFSWFIDTTPPTATVFSEQTYTNAQKLPIDITFSEPCMCNGGFKCVNSSNCNVLVDGPALVEASSLRVLTAYIKYSINLILSPNTMYGRVIVTMANKICTDDVGNQFTHTNASILIIHLDRRPLQGDLWTSMPSYVLSINGVSTTVLATNKEDDLDFYLDFLSPVSNSTEQIQSALHVNSGRLIPIQAHNHANHRFGFQLRNISKTDIITVELRAESVYSKTGARVLPVAPISFLYDSSKPGVRLSTSSPRVTKKPHINVIVEFTKPVFGFEASMVIVNGGNLTRFVGLSRALYALTVTSVPLNVVSVSVPADKVNDISGNLNLASNRLEVEHYSVPAISLALNSFMTVGVLATSFATSVLAISSSNLQALDTFSTRRTNAVTSSPSTNLRGMVGHLQVFVLSDWLSDNLPVDYSETIRGLSWLIPRQKLPWKQESTSMWPNHFQESEEKFIANLTGSSIAFPSIGKSDHPFFLNSTYSSCLQDKLLFPPMIDPKNGWLHGQQNTSMKTVPYGLPLNSKEYFTYFWRGEPLSANNIVKRMENNKGREDMEMNLFWLGVGGGSLVLTHFLILQFQKWRIKTQDHGILSLPRFELFLLILTLPNISQSSAFLIRGGTTGGIITGAMLLAIPAALILSVALFLTIVIFSGNLVQYKEVQFKDRTNPWFTKLWVFFVGYPTNGKWFYKEGLPSFLKQFEILFDNRKGPPLYIFIDQNDPNGVPKWVESGQGGIGRMRAISSYDSNEEAKLPMRKKLFGFAKSMYILFDLTRMATLGFLSGAFSTRKSSQNLIALIITVLQFLCLFTLKPYIRRGTHVAESLSLLSEAGIFGISTCIKGSTPMKEKNLGYVMLSLLFVTFASHAINEWYSMIKSLLKLSQPNKNSFKLGLKCAIQGLVLPFIPRNYWSSIIPNTALATVFPLSPTIDPVSAMSATVVPMASPGSPSPHAVQRSGSMEDGLRLKGVKVESMSELRQLRELAKASFSLKVEEGSTSYGFGEQTEICPDICQLSSLKDKL